MWAPPAAPRAAYPETASAVRGWLPLLPREARGPGFPSFPTLASPERALYDLISYFIGNSGLSSFNESAPRPPAAGAVPFPSPFAGSPEPPSQPCTRREGLSSSAGKGGTEHRESPGQAPRQPPPPALPRRGPPALSAASRGGMAKFPCRSCLGELAGTLLPRGSQ